MFNLQFGDYSSILTKYFFLIYTASIHTHLPHSKSSLQGIFFYLKNNIFEIISNLEHFL